MSLILSFFEVCNASLLRKKIQTSSSFQYNSHHRLVNHRLTKSFTRKISSTPILNAYKDKLLDILDREQIISSPKSKTVKLYQNISNKGKARNEHKLTLVEGHRLVIDTLSNPFTRNLYKDILVSMEALNHPQLGEPLSEQLNELMNQDINNCRVHLAEPNVVNAACDTVTPQGVVALVGMPQPYQFPDASDKHVGEGESRRKIPFYLILDGISDPGNVGTLIRSAKATGIEAIIILPNSCDVFSPKAIRSSMGTTFQVPVLSVTSWNDCYDLMIRCGISGAEIYAATMDGNEDADENVSFESIPYFDVDWHEPNSKGKALIIGKEGTGLSEEVREAFSNGDIRTIHVPMEQGIESLNAAVCGSVIMFDYHRQIIKL